LVTNLSDGDRSEWWVAKATQSLFATTAYLHSASNPFSGLMS
jgi:hypothetical protein